MEVTDIQVSDDGITLKVNVIPRKVALQDQSSLILTEVPFSVLTDSQIQLRFTEVSKFLPNRIGRYDFRTWDPWSVTESTVLNVNGFESMPVWARYFRAEPKDQDVTAHFYINRKGFLSVVMKPALEIDNSERVYRWNHALTEVRLRARKLEVEFDLKIEEQGDFRVTEFGLRNNSNLGKLTLATSVQVRRAANSLAVRATFARRALERLPPSRHTFYVRLHDELTNNSVTLRVNHFSKGMYERLYSALNAPRMRLNKSYTLALSTNSHTTMAGILVRPASVMDQKPWRNIVHGTIAKLYGAVSRQIKMPSKPTAIIFEKNAASAQDNGYSFFLYLKALADSGKRLPFNFVFVLSRNSPQWNELQSARGVIAKNSLKMWMLLAKAGNFTVSSDIRFHLAEQYAQPDLLNKYLYMRRNYFLQHGVLGLKRVGLLDPGHSMQPDAMLVSAKWEKDLAVKAGFAPGAIDVTGLPRWDRLFDYSQSTKQCGGSRKILYMPTWRTWLEEATTESLSESVFFQEVKNFLGSERLRSVLEKYDAELLFVAHPLFRGSLNDIDTPSDRVSVIANHDVNLPEQIATAHILITDYSSVLWDFVQSGKHVLLYQFDRKQYQQETGVYEHAHLSEVLRSIPTAMNLSEGVSSLEGILRLPSSESERQLEKRRSASFDFFDRENSRRVFEAIEARLSKLRKTRPMPTYEWADRRHQQIRSSAARRAVDTTSPKRPHQRSSQVSRMPVQGKGLSLQRATPAQARRRNRELVEDIMRKASIPYFMISNEFGAVESFGVEASLWGQLLKAIENNFHGLNLRVKTLDIDGKPKLSTLTLAESTSLDSMINLDSLVLFEQQIAMFDGYLGRSFGCRIEKWDLDDSGTLHSRLPNTRANSIGPGLQKTITQTVGDHDSRTTFSVLSKTSPFEVREPIDVVYMWVDGSDENWLRIHNHWMAKLTGVAVEDSVSAARFRDNGELRYSMRSVFQYCDWVRNIILVTDSQVPDWLDTTHPRIRMVDHAELFKGEGNLPTYNSHAIASRIHHIEGLSERYLIMNDDVFIGREIGPEQFFLSNGISKFFLSRSTLPQGNSEGPTHEAARKNVVSLLEREFGVTPSRNFYHAPLTQVKSLLFELEDKYPLVFRHTWKNQLRDQTDYEINGWLHHYYGYLTRRALPSSIVYDYISLDDPRFFDRLGRLLRDRNVSTFCVNDSPDATDQDLNYLAQWLNQYFPQSAPWEKY